MPGKRLFVANIRDQQMYKGKKHFRTNSRGKYGGYQNPGGGGNNYALGTYQSCSSDSECRGINICVHGMCTGSGGSTRGNGSGRPKPQVQSRPRPLRQVREYGRQRPGRSGINTYSKAARYSGGWDETMVPRCVFAGTCGRREYRGPGGGGRGGR